MRKRTERGYMVQLCAADIIPTTHALYGYLLITIVQIFNSQHAKESPQDFPPLAYVGFSSFSIILKKYSSPAKSKEGDQRGVTPCGDPIKLRRHQTPASMSLPTAQRTVKNGGTQFQLKWSIKLTILSTEEHNARRRTQTNRSIIFLGIIQE